ncbi:hypothetical protein JTE90_012000 [Oedothorax gibbosus]|uniref:Protein kinase domain-containing protein n=1 Tax=Oedothorax gibbosus TaxID=931172 RepID=A0AAV6URE4_9ARAC|nr:hypothetical protein JTE90_012000 [Oedothorax gibbosus]
MSVICQNFVQNAWKKDLCSNCFKSVGDHDISATDSIDAIQHSNQNENLNIRYVSNSPNSCTHTSNNNSTPHTTWKSLISERNSKNSQPFKLETGFQGRLLTINKAANGIEKKTSKAKITNGNTSDSQLSSCDEQKGTTNGHAKKKKSEISHFKKNTANGHSVQNGSKCHRNANTKIMNGIKSKNNEGKKEALIKTNSPQYKESALSKSSDELSSPEYDVQKPRLFKSKSEDSLTGLLPGILKKSSLSPANQPRRGSNVGFIDEEPLVIGYGGRDFSPEELEWEMNTSDVENEHGSDSLDETEDDKAFSKMTRLNTEFNSDNANLLQKIKQNSSRNNTLERGANDKDKKIVDRSSQNTKMIETGTMNNSKVVIECKNKNSEIEKNSTRKEKDGNVNEVESKTQTKVVNLADNDTKSYSQNTKRNDSPSAAVNSDKINSVVSSGRVIVVETARVGNSSEAAKNKPASPQDTLPPSNAIPIQNTQVAGQQGNSVMFSDGEERVEKTNENTATLPEEENSEWQEGDGMAGQILQAINTSLTNRHNSQQMDKFEESELSDNPAQGSGEEHKENNTSIDINKSKTESDDFSENLKGMEPRTSFLHGITSNEKPAKPSAIYGPASDLFVSRSDSSSSSSSDELSRNETPHSINVIVNGKNSIRSTSRNRNACVTESENEDARSQHSQRSEQMNKPSIIFKTKPKLPAKPIKQPVKPPLTQTKSLDFMQENRRNSDSATIENGSYYSVSSASIYSEGPKSITLVDHYAESNIYQEVDEDDIKSEESDPTEKAVPRESRLAALAIELEQVRLGNGGNNTKRQAPAPPKIPEPPQEDPPNCTGRSSPTVDAPLGFSSFRGEAIAFSSSSSTTSTSSQETEAGYASWNLHGEGYHDQRKQSKSSKSSFLLTQYSKCKMLAMGYAEDSARSRKKFSLKKLLKMKKENENSAAFDSNSPNPKAWKYSDHFERPRAKLEIIHPMDLENKSVTVNPGFDLLHSGSMSSFSASADNLSLRNSVSSDYGSFYSDTMSPMQDLKSEVNYECLQSRLPLSEHEDQEERQQDQSGGSNSPTPSRTSSVSQASTLTSGSSKNGGASPQRPPKPPPPPRAHSLLPSNKAINPDGTFKFPVVNCNNTETSVSSTKPQAPKRQWKASSQRIECGIYDNNVGLVSVSEAGATCANVENGESMPDEGNNFETILEIKTEVLECSTPKTMYEINSPDTPKPNEDRNENQTTILEVKPEPQNINVTVKTNVTDPNKLSKSVLMRNKNSPVTKAPARPPPIYMKPQISNIVKNPNPWKSLEDSYLVLSTSNRELLVKVVNQSLKKRKSFLAQLQAMKFQWSDFEIDTAQPSAVFAFGEKIAYHATIPKHPEYTITLVVNVQQQQNRMNENNELKYPVFGQFLDYIPQDLLDNFSDVELESIQATVLVLNRANISTIECFSENLPKTLSADHEKELSFIILQLIHSVKSLQAQGIESIDPSFQNLILAKSKQDKYNTLVFLSDNCYEEHDYVSDSCKVSLCQYALMLLYQMLGIQSAEELAEDKFSSDMARKVFYGAINLFAEEKAVSLSQTKILFESFLWDVTKVVDSLDESDDIDSVLHRWFDIKRVNYIKSIIEDESDIDVQSELYSQFLLRTSVRNIKEIIAYL